MDCLCILLLIMLFYRLPMYSKYLILRGHHFVIFCKWRTTVSVNFFHLNDLPAADYLVCEGNHENQQRRMLATADEGICR